MIVNMNFNKGEEGTAEMGRGEERGEDRRGEGKGEEGRGREEGDILDI